MQNAIETLSNLSEDWGKILWGALFWGSVLGAGILAMRPETAGWVAHGGAALLGASAGAAASRLPGRRWF